MKFTFIYPYGEINSRSLFHDTLTMLEYTSLRFANYLAVLGCDVRICSQNSTCDIHDNITYDNITSAYDMDIENLIIVDSLNYLNLKAMNKYSWLSSSIDDISLREHAVNLINYDVKVITFQDLGGDFEIPYAIMEMDCDSLLLENGLNVNNGKPYAVITTNPHHGLQEIINVWDNSLIDLHIVSKGLYQSDSHEVKIPDDMDNIKVIYPTNCDHMVDIIKNARFYILPQLPPTVFNSFAIMGQYYGVSTLSYNYKYDEILHKNNMGGVNVKGLAEFKEYVHLLSDDDDMIQELSKQASILRSDISMEKIFIELAGYFNVAVD